LPYEANYFVKNGGLVGPIKRSLYKDHPLNHSKATIPKLGPFPPYSAQRKNFYPKKKDRLGNRKHPQKLEKRKTIS
jgi:hypothetical protein